MTLSNCLILSSILFFVGVYGVMTRRNLIGVLMSVELMLNAANINFISFAYFKQGVDSVAGSVFVIMIISVAACEMAVGLAIIVTMYRKHKEIDITRLGGLQDE